MIRDATTADVEGIVAVAASHGFDEPDSGVDPGYLELVAGHGRLAVALEAGAVVGFGGTVRVFGAAMVTDLFVLDDWQGRGIGSRLLDHLLAGEHERMTFSSKHPLAIPAYRRMGMLPRWRLRYLRGSATGLDEAGVGGWREVGLEAWSGDRPELVRHWVSRGGRALVHDREGTVDATAILSPTERGCTVQRLIGTDGDSGSRALVSLLGAVDGGVEVTLCVPEVVPASALLDGLGFVEFDHDVHCATRDLVPAGAVVLHPGLA